MPVKFLKQAFLFFAHEYGQVIFAERKLEMDAPHIRVDDMRFNIERTVGEPGAACGIVHIIERKGAGLQIAETKLYRIRFLLIKERKRSDVLIVGSLAKMNGETFKLSVRIRKVLPFILFPISDVLVPCSGSSLSVEAACARRRAVSVSSGRACSCIWGSSSS